MRLLHTSDWHLGADLGGHDRLDEQRRFLDWFRALAGQLQVDALLIAGDVYDVANPSSAAQRTFADFLVGLHRDCPATTIVVVGGNHDSAARLEIARPFGDALGRVHVVGSVDVRSPDMLDKGVIVLRDLGGAALGACLAVPFMRPSELDCRVADGETMNTAYERSLGALYARLREHAARLVPELPLVAMGHLTLSRGEKSGSEHVLVGGIDGVAAEPLAAGLDYLALGHLHRAQRIGDDRVRYCGSPYPIDFDERRYPHQVLLVEVAAPGAAPLVTPVEVPSFVTLWRIPEQPGTIADLERDFSARPWQAYAQSPPSLHPFVELTLLDDGTLPDLRARVEALCAGRPLRLVGSPRRVRPAELAAPRDANGAPPARLALDEPDAASRLMTLAWRRKYDADPPPEILAAFAEIQAQVDIGGGDS